MTAPKPLSQLHALVDEDRLCDREWYTFFGKLQEEIDDVRTTLTALASKVWVTFDASGGSIASQGGNGIATVVRNAPGDYTISFSTAFANTRYVVIGNCQVDMSNPSATTIARSIKILVKSTGAVRILTARVDTNNVGEDQKEVSLAFFGA